MSRARYPTGIFFSETWGPMGGELHGRRAELLHANEGEHMHVLAEQGHPPPSGS
jgi:hypothetical protein